MHTDEFTEIPLVDVGALQAGTADRRKLAGQVREICHEVGFLLIVNHGISPSLVDSIFEMMHTFFALPEADKMLIDKRASPQFRGWEPVGSEYTNNRPDRREQIDLWTEWPTLGPDVEPPCLRLLGPNQWMPDTVLARHRELSLRWFDQLGALANQLLGLLSLGLGLEETHLQQYFGAQPMSLAKFIHYPPTPPGEAGVNAHHDAGFLTVLAPGPTPGLEVQNPAGDWVAVEPVPGAFVVNLGEILQAMTGNYFVATPHRVITDQERFSAGYFHGPSLDTVLAPLDLDRHFVETVAASPRHAAAGFMALAEETADGVGDMASSHRPSTYGDQLWNYFSRSYPANMALHHSSSATVDQAGG